VSTLSINSNYFQDDILIFDTTLRDGEQTPGVSLTPEKKLEIARKLDEFGVNIIEAGMTITSLGEREAIKLIANANLNAEVYSGCRMVKTEIEYSKQLGVSGVQIIVPTSKLHQEVKLGKKREEVTKIAVETVKFAKSLGLKVGVSAEDASRTELTYLIELFTKLQDAGVDRVCYCDTVGVLVPEETYKIFRKLVSTLEIPIEVHCHNDFGLATANTIAALKAGAKVFHCTVNGIGERAGNTPVEEVVMVLRQLYNRILPVKYEKIFELSREIALKTNVQVPANKAIVGVNAFTHESGIHTDGMFKDIRMYEPFPPEIVGRKRKYVIGKHSGRNQVKASLEELGFHLTDDQIAAIVQKVKQLAEKSKLVTEADLVALTYEVLGKPLDEFVKLEELTVVTGNKITPLASVHIIANGKKYMAAGTGVGPVDAAVNAIKNATNMITNISLVNYEVKSITGGTNALVDVVITLGRGDIERKGRGVSEDIINASISAYLSAINQILMANDLKSKKNRT